MFEYLSKVVFFLISLMSCQVLGGLPVVMWHGLGDVCCNPLSLGGLQKFIEEQVPGIYVKSLQIGKSVREDFENAYIKNVNDQVNIACNQIKNDSKLSAGYHGLGISQGGQFLRAVAQRCPDPPMVNLITLGSQHQGIFGLPHCLGDDLKLCDYIRLLLNKGAYRKWIQSFVTPAEYWHDPFDEKMYRSSSVFLADINNENAINSTYKKNLKALQNFVMVKFTKDTIVQPIATEWFGFYKENSTKETYSLQDSVLYQEDRLGLKEMDQQGKLHFYQVEGDHIQFSETWFNDTIISKYFV